MDQKKSKKELQTQLNNITAEMNAMKLEIANKQKEFALKSRIAKDLKKRIEAYKSGDDIVISEHAYLRFFERVKGFDLNEAKAEILSEKVLAFVEKLGPSGHYPNGGYQVVMKDNVVVTII